VEEELLVSVVGCHKAKAFGGVEPLHDPKAPLPCRRGSGSQRGCRPGVQFLLFISEKAIELLSQEQGLVRRELEQHPLAGLILHVTLDRLDCFC
jgi:hypothetical protein